MVTLVTHGRPWLTASDGRRRLAYAGWGEVREQLQAVRSVPGAGPASACGSALSAAGRPGLPGEAATFTAALKFPHLVARQPGRSPT